MPSSDGSAISFDADSTLAITDCSTSSSAISNQLDCIIGTCEQQKGVTTSGIVSGLQASDIVSIVLPLKDDRRDEIN